LRIGIRHVLRDGADEVADTWVHESLHGRAPRTLNWTVNTQQRGYEEGMVEGLLLQIRQLAGWGSSMVAYPGYVRAYERLALRLGITDDLLYRRLWQQADIDMVFVDEIDQLMQRQGSGLAAAQATRLRTIADWLFSTPPPGVGYTGLDDADIDRAWESAFA
jgi:hypothetical protein